MARDSLSSIYQALRIFQKPLSQRANLPVGLGYTTGQYYGPALAGSYSATVFGTGGDVFVPFFCRKTKTFDRIAIRNTAAETFNLRMAIYTDDGGGVPTTLLADSGQLTTAGAAGDNAATISQQLLGGTLYWLALATSGNLTTQAITAPSEHMTNILDFPIYSTSTFATSNIGFQNGRAFAAFPATATIPTGFTGPVPLIRLRAA